MASPTQNDPTNPRGVASATFSAARRGYHPGEVTNFLRAVATEIARLRERISQLQAQLASARAAAVTPDELDEATMLRLLGEETSRVLATARASATEIKKRSEAIAAEVVAEAEAEANNIRMEGHVDAARIREQAAVDSRAASDLAREEARSMAIEVREYRERVLADLDRRTELAKGQIAELIEGRDRLLQVFERARLVAMDVSSGVKDLDLPTEYVNLDPTTGPVPVMVKADPPPNAADTPVNPNQGVPIEFLESDDGLIGGGGHHDGGDGGDDDSDGDGGGDGDDHPPPAGDSDATSHETTDDETTHDGASDDHADAETADVDLDIVVVDTFGDPAANDQSGDDQTGDDERTNVVPFQRRHDSDHDQDDDPGDDQDDGDEYVTDEMVDESETINETIDTDTTDTDTDTVEDEAADEADHPATEDVARNGDSPTAADESDDAEDGEDGDAVGGLFARLRSEVPAEAEQQQLGLETGESTESAGESAGESTGASPAVEVDVLEPEAAPEVVIQEALDLGSADAATIFAIRAKQFVAVADPAARKLKRVLADEQNEVLQVLRTGATDGVDDLLPPPQVHAEAYIDSISDEIAATATAAAAAVGSSSPADVTDAVRSRVISELIDPLRHRLDRAVRDGSGDNETIAKSVRAVYREWKTQYVDAELAELLRVAFATAASAAIPFGTPVQWTPDPDAVACAECEDNSLAGAIVNGQPFPTGHTKAPAHTGCRCLPVPR